MAKKKIVICCDGTGNPSWWEPSNVLRLYSVIEINDTQVAYYHPGVGFMGAETAHTRVGEAWSRVTGLAFGTGLSQNLRDVYSYLMQTYSEGDDIYLFGFSRGAYTVLALASVLNVYGLLHCGSHGLLAHVTRSFATYSRLNAGYSSTFSAAANFKRTFSREVIVHFVGVWDTVGSVGFLLESILPSFNQSPILPFGDREPGIRIGRQALAIDERRRLYPDNPWGTPFQVGEEQYSFAEPQDIKQVWFAGVHADVGGGYAEENSGLSKLALEWMLHEASGAGLQINTDRATELLGRVPLDNGRSYAKPDPAAKMHESLRGAWWALEYLPHEFYDKQSSRMVWRIPLGAPRQIIPNQSTVVHESVQQRLNLIPDYTPANLPSRNLSDYVTIEPRIEFPPARRATSAAL